MQIGIFGWTIVGIAVTALLVWVGYMGRCIIKNHPRSVMKRDPVGRSILQAYGVEFYQKYCVAERQRRANRTREEVWFETQLEATLASLYRESVHLGFPDSSATPCTRA